MKVAELKIGMMVKPIDPNDRFLKSPTGGWITVARKRKSFGWPYSIRTNSNVTDTEDQKIAVYLGRKKISAILIYHGLIDSFCLRIKSLQWTRHRGER